MKLPVNGIEQKTKDQWPYHIVEDYFDIFVLWKQNDCTN